MTTSSAGTERARLLGVARPREDSLPKVAGSVRFAGDVVRPGMLHARLVLSPIAHGYLKGVDRQAALAVSGVVDVLVAADLPLKAGGEMRASQPLAADEILFAGQPVALVVAETEAAAADGAALVVIDTEPLPPVTELLSAEERAWSPDHDIDAGMAIHAAVGQGSQDSLDPESSAAAPRISTLQHGDVEAALRECDVVAAGVFETPWMYQAPLEAQVGIAWVEPDGQLVVEASTQGTFFVRQMLSDLLDMPLGKVCVKPAVMGGAFGAKLLIIEPLVAAAALRLGRPVRLAFSRSEDFYAGQPASAARVALQIGARSDGELVALKAEVVLDAGAFPEWSIESVFGALIGGPYHWRSWDVSARSVITNRFGTGPYRAPGGPPAAFALESLVNEIADRLELDPIAVRLASLAKQGDERLDGVEWPTVGTRECLEALARHPLWQMRGRLASGEGVAVAAGIWPGSSQSAAASCRLESDGSFRVATGAPDMTGSETAFAMLVAEKLGIAVEQVTVRAGDTDTAPFGPVAAGSTSVYSVGQAVQEAAIDARRQILEVAGAELEVAPNDLELVDGVVRPKGVPQRAIGLAELASRVFGFGSAHPPIDGRGAVRTRPTAPSAAAHVAHVRVDPDTGHVRVVSYAIAQDVGRALNPALVEGQMRGGVAQAIGWALLEELVHDDDGQLLTGSFLDYAIPRAVDVPPIDTIIVEVPSEHGPWGARGIGEAPVVAGPAAIASAITAATGVPLRRLPVTAARLWSAMNGAGAGSGLAAGHAGDQSQEVQHVG
jgi:CO/xanthine dehydrogenase Mo-binding subunit